MLIEENTKTKLIIKKNRTAVVALLTVLFMILGIVLTGCSTPDNAASIKDGDGKLLETYSTGEYTAAVYETIVSSEQFQYIQAMGGEDSFWEQEINAGEESGETITLNDMFAKNVLDNIAYRKATELLMAEYKVEPSEEDNAAYEKVMETYSLGESIGFNKESFGTIYKSTTYEKILFSALYGKGGQREVAQADISSYYDKNILTYKIVELPLVDAESKELDEAGKKEARDKIDSYLKLYESKSDFNKVVEDFTVAQGKEYKATETLSDFDKNLGVIDIALKQNEPLANEIQKLEFEKAKIVEYTNSKDVVTVALILRVDPKLSDLFKLEKISEDIVANMKYEEFTEEIKKSAKNVKVEINEKIKKTITPKSVYADILKNQQAAAQ